MNRFKYKGYTVKRYAKNYTTVLYDVLNKAGRVLYTAYQADGPNGYRSWIERRIEKRASRS